MSTIETQFSVIKTTGLFYKNTHKTYTGRGTQQSFFSDKTQRPINAFGYYNNDYGWHFFITGADGCIEWMSTANTEAEILNEMVRFAKTA